MMGSDFPLPTVLTSHFHFPILTCKFLFSLLISHFLTSCLTETTDSSKQLGRQSFMGVVGCWVNFQCRGVLLIWIRVGQGLIALAIGAGGGCLDIFFSHLSSLFSFSLSLGDGPI